MNVLLVLGVTLLLLLVWFGLVVGTVAGIGLLSLAADKTPRDPLGALPSSIKQRLKYLFKKKGGEGEGPGGQGGSGTPLGDKEKAGQEKGGGGVEANHDGAAHGGGHGDGMRACYIVWGVLLGVTLFEVALAALHMPVLAMLASMMGLSLVKAALIMAYFMHLKFERLSFILTVVPATVLVIVMLGVVYPDGFRLEQHRKPAWKAATTGTGAGEGIPGGDSSE